MGMYAAETTVPVEKSRAEIERLLARFHCTQFSTGSDWETRRALVQFKAQGRVIRFVLDLPNPADRVFTHDKRKVQRAPSSVELMVAQALRQKWRALLLVIKAKLEAVESRITVFEEEFLAHIVLPDDSTVGERVLPQIAGLYASRAGQLLIGGAVDGEIVDGAVR